MTLKALRKRDCEAGAGSRLPRKSESQMKGTPALWDIHLR